MSYQVLALKYRPQTFDDVVGQAHVTTTLTNAINSNRVAHAILFTGPRGTGKTTIARILAKAMNCKQGTSPAPCNQCKICTDIIDGHCSDVFEIDGASNNSVDQIRDLRENVTYMPSTAKYKIYIIDEVHMLSTAAFNALLKTLEEPPDHVMFIFATTEVHKIPATILSRCQRHDLGRISLDLIAGHLNHLCEQEGYTIDNATIDLVAREADGSIRDSLSLLDRILSSSGSLEIDHSQVLENLGILDAQIMHEMSAAIFENNGARIIELLEQVNDSGMDLKKYYTDLILYFRNLNVIKLCGSKSQNVNLSDAEKERLFNACANLDSRLINAVLQTLLDDESLVKYSSHTRTAIEMVLLKLVRVHPGGQIDQIISKLDLLAKQMGSGTGTGQIKSRAYHTPDSMDSRTSSPSSQQPAQSPAQRRTPDNQAAHQPPRPPEPPPGAMDYAHRQPPAHGPGRQQEHETTAPANQEPVYEKNWSGFLKKIETRLPFMFVLLTKAQVTQKAPNQIIATLNNCSSFDRKRIQTKKKELQNSCKAFLDKELVIQTPSPENVQAPNNKKKNEIKAKHAAFSHPLVVEAQKMFNGEIINH